MSRTVDAGFHGGGKYLRSGDLHAVCVTSLFLNSVRKCVIRPVSRPPFGDPFGDPMKTPQTDLGVGVLQVAGQKACGCLWRGRRF